MIFFLSFSNNILVSPSSDLDLLNHHLFLLEKSNKIHVNMNINNNVPYQATIIQTIFEQHFSTTADSVR